MQNLDDLDRKILNALQKDCGLSLDDMADQIGLSRNAIWRRIRQLEESGTIRARVALLDGDKLDLRLTVFMLIRTSQHDPDWLGKFARATRAMPAIMGAYRMTGDLDYLVRAQVSDMADYDRLYQDLIRRVDMTDVSASFVMEVIKDTTALPV